MKYWLLFILYSISLYSFSIASSNPRNNKDAYSQENEDERCYLYKKKETLYNEENGLPHWHITQMLQDKDGFMWFSSWNGLCRFDGTEFITFKSKAGDGCPISTDRIRDIRLADNNDIFCRIDEQWFLFSQTTNQFSVISEAQNRLLNSNIKGRTTRFNGKDKVSFEFSDRQDNLWQIIDKGILKITMCKIIAPPFHQEKPAQVKCLAIDSLQRLWITTREDKTIRIYNKELQLEGYLCPDGRLSKKYTSFGSAIYSIYPSAHGIIYLGAKQDGYFKLTPQKDQFAVTHHTVCSDKSYNSVYNIKEDSFGRLWIATLGSGIFCQTQDGQRVKIAATDQWKVRYLHITRDTVNHCDVLLAATTEGLAIGKIVMPQEGYQAIGQMKMTLHKREADRDSSLSCSATMDILENRDHHLFISSESGGINEITSQNLLDSTLNFKHYDTSMGLNTDVVMSLTEYNDDIYIVGSNALSIFNPTHGHIRTFDQSFFKETHHYSDAHPIHLPNGQWIFGTQTGAFCIADSAFAKSGYLPTLAWTGLSIEHRPIVRNVNHWQKITLTPFERNVSLYFAALDFSYPEDIKYAFRLHKNEAWNFIGKSHFISLSDLQPGTYDVQIKSTNADGIWTDNIRTLEITVTPKFSETIWAQLLLLLLILGLTLAGIYAYLFIKRMKSLQQKTLKAYLALLNKQKNENADIPEQAVVVEKSATLSSEDDRLLKRIIAFIEAHMADAEIGISEMADAAALSKSSLNRKLKQIVGLTPAEFLREARIKEACRLLKETKLTVTEITYACGFTDAKYFGRIFRSCMGKSPSEYRSEFGQ